MRRMITVIVGLWVVLVLDARAQVTVLAVRLGANDVVALAKFYDAAFGLKEIDRVGNPATEIIMKDAAFGGPIVLRDADVHVAGRGHHRSALRIRGL